jgi:predicted DNA-binding ribbon-helix-helix protein
MKLTPDHTDHLRIDRLQREMNMEWRIIADALARRESLSSAYRVHVIEYLKKEEALFQAMGYTMDNSDLIALMQLEENAYRARIAAGEW